MELDYHGDQHATHYMLREPNARRLYQLSFPEAQEPNIGSGLLVRVQVRQQAGSASSADAGPVAGPAHHHHRHRHRQLQGHQTEHGRRFGPLSSRVEKKRPTFSLTRATAVSSAVDGSQSGHHQSTARRSVQAETGAPISAAPNVVLDVISWEILEQPVKPPPPPKARLKSQVLGRSGGTTSETTSQGYVPKYNTDRMLMDDVSAVVFIVNMCGRGLAASREVSQAHNIMVHISCMWPW